jgi:cell division protein FtsX
MKAIEVKEQVSLSLGKCLELVLSGVRFRLFRAAITVVIVALAVAFLMTMLSESLIGRRATDAIKARLAPRQNLLFWVGRLSMPLKEAQLSEQLAAIQADKEAGKLTDRDRNRTDEFLAWGALGEADLDKLCDLAKRQGEYLRFFDELTEGQRRVLLGRAQGAEAFPRLSTEPGFKEFQNGLRQLGRQMPTGVEGFKVFLADWTRTEHLRKKILVEQDKQLNRLKKDLLKDQTPKEMFARSDESLPTRLKDYGFRMDGPELEDLRRLSGLSLEAERVKQAGKFQEVKSRLANRLNIKNAAEIVETTLLSEAATAGGAKWLQAQVGELKKRLDAATALKLKDKKPSPEDEALMTSREVIESFTMDAGRIQQAAQFRLEEIDLAKVESGIADALTAPGKGWLGFSSRTRWLILVSFMVCMVGIANAMLMSVTERFREIATMKCLGATDGFIMINFILESCMQGVAGGVVGAMLGFLLGALRSWGKFGWVAMQNIPAVEVLLTALASIVMGVVLSAGAAVYPAYVAARLAPMEAMRIE